MCFTRCCDACCIFGKSDGCLDYVSFYIHMVFEHRIYISASPCAELTSNTKLECEDIIAVDMDDYFDPKIIIFD